MSSTPARVAAAHVAAAVALALAACSTPADSTPSEAPPGGGQVAPGIPETPVITGEPASHNADDVSFATNMISHHEQAIELSKMVPDRTTNSELTALANQIATVQQPEINIMNVLLVQWNENPDLSSDPNGRQGHAGHGPSAGMVDAATMAELESLRGAEFDTLWLETMISHHRGAVEMANAEIANGENVDAVAMAKRMMQTQEAEIVQMKEMLEGSRP